MLEKPVLVIVAAEMGSRYVGLKQIDPIDAEERSRISRHMEVSYAFQEPGDFPDSFEIPENRAKPLGSAHTVRDTMYGSFASISADDSYGRHPT